MARDRETVEDEQSAASEFERLVRLLWRSRYGLIISMVAGLAVGGVVAWLTEPVYRATVVLIPVQDTGIAGSLGSALSEVGGLAALVGLDGLGGDRTSEGLAVLASRKFTEAFIKDFALLPQLFPDDWDPNTKKWRVSSSRPPSLYDGYVLFDDIRKIRRDGKTGLVSIDFIWPDAKSAAILANAMVSRLNNDIRQRDIDEATRSIEQLNAELERTRFIAVESAVQNLIETNVKRRTLAKARFEYAFRVIDPAIPVDKEDYFRPRPLLYVAAGAFCGLFLGIAVVALRQFSGFLRTGT